MEHYIRLLFVSVCVVGMSAAPSGSGQFGRLGVGLRVDMRARHCSVVGFLPDPLNLPFGTMGTWFFFYGVVGCWRRLRASCSYESRKTPNVRTAQPINDQEPGFGWSGISISPHK